MFKTIPHQSQVHQLRVCHLAQISGFCPATKNPAPGSCIEIKYKPKQAVLEAGSIQAHIDSYKGGKVMARWHVRNLETLVEQLAIDARTVLGVNVTVKCTAIMGGSSQMITLKAKAKHG